MTLLTCPHCGQTYNPRYMRYCARCGEAVPDEEGKLPAPGPMDGLGARGGMGVARTRSRGRIAASGLEAPLPETSRTGSGERSYVPPGQPSEEVPAAERQPPSDAVKDMVLEYRTRLNEAPEDHDARYSLALAYLYAEQWEQAEAELLIVIEALPDFADAHARLAVCQARSGNLSGALEAARAAHNLQPDNRRFQSLLERLERAIENANS